MSKFRKNAQAARRKRAPKPVGHVMESAVLHLNLHREFFDLIAMGKKRIEFRDCTPYWRRRLEGRDYALVQFRNGYATRAPTMQVAFRGYGVRKLAGGWKYAIRLGPIVSIKGWKPPRD